MNPAAARIVSVAAIVIALGAGAWTWLLAGIYSLPGWAALAPVATMSVIVPALALVLSTTPRLQLARRLGATCLLLAAAALAGWGFTATAGASVSEAPRWPPPLDAAGVAFLGAALWRRDPRREHLDASAILGTLAAAVFFLLLLGHLFGAAALAPGGAQPGLVVALWLAMALALLRSHPGSPLAAFTGDDPGANAKRRLLPAAVGTPVLTGFLLAAALAGDRISAMLAVSLAVFANVLVMLVLINAAGNSVRRVTSEQHRRMRVREERTRRQGLRDAMTAMLNRRGWDAQVKAAEKRCRAHKIDAGVILIDLDGLKRVNDSQGHKAGDQLITRAAGALRRVAQRKDALARIGGDEFAYLIVDCDEDDARATLERLQASLATSRIEASLGYAMRGRNSIAAAFDEADAAMYRDKRRRRRRA